jgi:hypothetical protein
MACGLHRPRNVLQSRVAFSGLGNRRADVATPVAAAQSAGARAEGLSIGQHRRTFAQSELHHLFMDGCARHVCGACAREGGGGVGQYVVSPGG